ncbi:MAG: TIM barrel protein, partial [Kiritimatiellae bacterium]|nr:TIM barrel protein [Kiritimatiellia bacterium]
VCGAPPCAKVAKQAGFDYFEWSVQGFLQPQSDRAAFLEALAAARAAPLPCPVCNGFLPGTLKIVGPQVDATAVEAYVATACARAAEAGVDTIVFGSGGARQVPDGFDRKQAEAQIAAFLKLLSPHARQHGVTIAVEPLRFAECNILNTVAECAAAVRAADSPAIRLLVDGYHWACNAEATADIMAAAPLFCHMHVATQANRRTPGAEPCEALPRFLAAVRQIGYRGRMSIEGRIDMPETELPAAARMLRSA